MEHTKGEWEVSNMAASFVKLAIKELEDLVTVRALVNNQPHLEYETIAVIFESGKTNNAEANAHLIAAAPETKKQRDALLAACKEANTEIIAALKIPFDKRLAKDKDNLIYVIRDMRAREDRAQQKLKQAIAESEE